jgi:hypothetical protein
LFSFGEEIIRITIEVVPFSGTEWRLG